MIPFDANINGITLGVIFTISFVALVINGLLLYVLPRVRGKKNVTGIQFIVSVAVSDIVTALFGICMCIVEMISGHDGLLENNWYCSFLSSGLFYTNGISGLILSIVAIERFLLVCFNKKMPIKITWVICFIVTVVCIVPLFKHGINGTYMFDYTYVFCLPLRSNVAGFAKVAKNCMFAIPLFILSVCYIGIFVSCYRQQKAQVSYLSSRASIRALCFFIFYFLCYLPNFIAMVRSSKSGPLPMSIAVMIPIGLLFVMILNPILVLFLHHELKSKIQEIIRYNKSIKILSP